MSAVVKAIKKGASSVVRRTKGAVKGAIDGDLSSIGDVLTGGQVTQFKRDRDMLQDAFTPSMPDINIPEQPAVGAAPGSVSRGRANVDIGATEGQRRVTGSAKGSRKLRVPLGGLR